MTRREMEITEPEKIREILEKSKVIHVGLVDEGMPYVVPMNYGYSFDGSRMTIYMHGAKKGYKLDVIRKNPICCFEMECEVEPFTGDVACKYGTAYSCLMGRGRIGIVEDTEEKKQAMTLLMKAQTGGDFEFDDKLVSVVSVLRIDTEVYTAKHRPAPQRKSP